MHQSSIASKTEHFFSEAELWWQSITSPVNLRYAQPKGLHCRTIK